MQDIRHPSGKCEFHKEEICKENQKPLNDLHLSGVNNDVEDASGTCGISDEWSAEFGAMNVS